VARGALAQLGEHQLCKLGVTGSIPVRSTHRKPLRLGARRLPHPEGRDGGPLLKGMVILEFLTGFRDYELKHDRVA
jgi:hypothetical protein